MLQKQKLFWLLFLAQQSYIKVESVWDQKKSENDKTKAGWKDTSCPALI
jgi:hypothetical protein